jgi:flagellar biosynthetic protein FliR
MITLTDQQVFAWLSAFLLPFFRVLGMMTSAPIFSNRSYPTRARVALAAAVALLVAPFAGAPDTALLGTAAGIGAVAQEVAVGITIGFVARLLFTGFEMAGELIGLQMGLSFAGFFDPQAGTANPVGLTINSVSTLTFVAINGPLALLATVIESFQWLPAGSSAAAFLSERSPLQLGAETFALALSLALPFMGMLLFVNVAMGVVSRVAPQLNLFGVGFPVTILVGLVMLSVGLPMIEAPLVGHFERLLAHLSR